MEDRQEEIKILIVDDDLAIREMCQDILQPYSVQHVADGSEVFPLLSGFQPNIVITDLVMPREGGISILRLIKKEFPQIEVLVMTGGGRIETAIEVMKLGASDFILKPFEISQFKLAVDKCIDRINIRQKNIYLQETNYELKKLTELKEKFLRLVSHELRGPLTVLQGYSDLLPALTDTPQELLAATDAMSLAITNLTSIVDNISLLLALKHNELPIVAASFNIITLAEKIIEEICVYARNRGHNILLENQLSNVIIEGDSLRVGQILRELVLNAVKYTPDQGNIFLKIKNSNDLRYFELIVKDEGIGIESNHLATIFEAFYETQDIQNHSTSRTNFMGGGLGVGLTLVKDITRAYKGNLGITSERGRGTEVTVSLPFKIES